MIPRGDDLNANKSKFRRDAMRWMESQYAIVDWDVSYKFAHAYFYTVKYVIVGRPSGREGKSHVRGKATNSRITREQWQG
jgi:hypothetical protein